MSLEKLKQLLASGAITQEEFDELAKNVPQEEESVEEEETDPENQEDTEEETSEENPDVDTLIAQAVQKAVDKVANKMGNENKKLKEQLKEEQKKNLSAEEIRKMELEEKEREILEKEQALRTESNRIYALKALKKAALDDGSEDTFELLDLVLGDDEEQISTKVKALEKYKRRIEANKVESIYKKNGRTPNKGLDGGSVKNPYSKESFNLTKQMELESKNPDLAKKLKASAAQ